MIKKELCVVLKKIKTGERDQLITALSPTSGKITAIAKNSLHSRRFGGCFDLFCTAEWTYTEKEGSELVRVDQADVKKSFPLLHKSWEQLTVASFLTEILIFIAPHKEPAQNLFQLYINTLLVLENTHNPADLLIITNSFLYKILQWSGLQPTLQACHHCGIKHETLSLEEALYAEPEFGGWHCSSCASKILKDLKSTSILLYPKDISFLAYLGAHSIKKINLTENKNIKNETLFEFLIQMIFYHLPPVEPQKLKTISFLPFGSFQRKRMHYALSNIQESISDKTFF